MAKRNLYTLQTPFDPARTEQDQRGDCEQDAVRRYFLARPELLEAARAGGRAIVWVTDQAGQEWAVPLPQEAA